MAQSIQITQPSDFNPNTPLGKLPAVGYQRTFNTPAYTYNGMSMMTEIGPGNTNPGGQSLIPGDSKSRSMVGGYNQASGGVTFGSIANFGMSAATSIMGALSARSSTKAAGQALASLSNTFGKMFSIPTAYADVGQVVSRSGAGNNVVLPNQDSAKGINGSGVDNPFAPGPAKNIGMEIPGSMGLGTSVPGLLDNAKKFTLSLLERAVGLVALSALKKDKYQRAYNWELLLPGIGILAPELMARYVQEVSFGEYSMDEVTKLRYGAETRHHAGVFNIPKVTVKFNKPTPDLVFTYLMLWKNLIVDSNGFFAAKSSYAMTGYLLMLDTTGTQSGSYKLVNMFPTRFPEQRMSYAANEISNYTVEFSVDRIESL